MKDDICVEYLSEVDGEQWWVYEDDELLAKFYTCPEDAHDFADLRRLRP